MPAERLTVLTLAARCSRVGYVVLVDGVPQDWHLSHRASTSSAMAAKRLNGWLGEFDPSVVVLEDYRSANRKSCKTRAVLKALQRTAHKSPAMVVPLRREQHHCNKFDEAHALAEQFPELAAWAPRRPKLWEREPRNLVYFEALALAVQSGLIANEQ